jgi:Transposase DDE domain
MSILDQYKREIEELQMFLSEIGNQAVRLIYERLPPSVVADRRRKAHEAARQRGHTCSKQTLASREGLLFVTNAPDALLNEQQIKEVYCVRWQFEWIFKVWKSEMNLDAIGNWRVERLLALLLFHGLLEKYPPPAGQEWSMTQAYQIVRASASRLLGIVRRDFWGIKAFLSDFGTDLRRFAVKTKRRKKLSTLDRLLAVRA